MTQPSNKQWQGRPKAARALAIAITVAPVLVVTVAVWFIYRSLGAPSSWGAAAVRFAALAIISTIAIGLLDRLARRLLPLTALMRMSLIFPDEAPSRFKSALKTGTTRQLERAMADGSLDESTPQDAAVLLLEAITELSLHDRLTRGHIERVRAYTDMVAIELDLDEEDRSKLHWAALLHDLGKLRVPEEILNKKGRPTDEEWEVLRRHPADGWKLITPLKPWLGDWARAALDHHERWDGTGYPSGHSGTSISVAGRIVAVADAYDVMTSTRSYKKPMTVEDARSELAACAGSHFDPKVVRAFLNISLGSLRRALTPLAWLAQLPMFSFVGATPLPALVSSIGTTAVLATASVGLLTTGMVPKPSSTQVAAIERVVETEDAPSDQPTQRPISEGEGGRLEGETMPRFAAESPVVPSTTVIAPLTTTTTTSPTQTFRPSTTTVPVPTTAAPTTSRPRVTTTTRPVQNPGRTTSTTAPPRTTTTTTTTTTAAPTTTTATTTTSTSTTTTSTSTTTTTTTTAPPSSSFSSRLSNTRNPFDVYSTFQMGPADDTGSLPDYDSWNDTSPGYTIDRTPSATGLDTTERTEYLRWTSAPLFNSVAFDGEWTMSIWASTRGFNPGDISNLKVQLSECTLTCETVGSGYVSYELLRVGYGRVDISITGATRTLRAGRYLQLKVVSYEELSTADPVLAFGTTTYPSTLKS